MECLIQKFRALIKKACLKCSSYHSLYYSSFLENLQITIVFYKILANKFLHSNTVVSSSILPYAFEQKKKKKISTSSFRTHFTVSNSLDFSKTSIKQPKKITEILKTFLWNYSSNLTYKTM